MTKNEAKTIWRNNLNVLTKQGIHTINNKKYTIEVVEHETALETFLVEFETNTKQPVKWFSFD